MIQKEIVKGCHGKIPVISNETKSKKMILFMHGLDGSANFSKPLFKKLSEYKIVAMETRGHEKSLIKSSRSTKKHLQDYNDVINHYKKKGYEIYLLGESMGAAYATEIAYTTKNLVREVFAMSIPSKLKNIMVNSKWAGMKIQFMTFLSFLTNINYKYKNTVNYKFLSSNKVLWRLATLADKNKTREVRETLSAWSMIKKSWRRMKNNKPLTKFIYFQGGNDILARQEKTNNILKKGNVKHYIFDDAKHILLYEKAFDEIANIIKSEMKQK